MKKPSRKAILFLGHPEAGLEPLREGLGKALGPEYLAPIVIAKDGPEALSRVENQKFDIIIVDSQAPRLRVGGCFASIQGHPNGKNADLITITPNETWELPKDLTGTSQVLTKPYDVDLLVRVLVKALQVARVEMPPENGRYAVDVRVVNALLKSTCFVCQQYGIEKIQAEKPTSKPASSAWVGDVAAMIPIVSFLFRGAMVVSFQKEAYLAIYSNMLGEEQKELNAENLDAIGELSNMILGNAKPEFTEYDVKMSIPKILQKGQPVASPTDAASILIPLQSSVGRIYIEVIAYRTE